MKVCVMCVRSLFCSLVSANTDILPYQKLMLLFCDIVSIYDNVSPAYLRIIFFAFSFAGIYNDIGQAFVVLLPVKSVGEWCPSVGSFVCVALYGLSNVCTWMFDKDSIRNQEQ